MENNFVQNFTNGLKKHVMLRSTDLTMETDRC